MEKDVELTALSEGAAECEAETTSQATSALHRYARIPTAPSCSMQLELLFFTVKRIDAAISSITAVATVPRLGSDLDLDFHHSQPDRGRRPAPLN